MSFLATVRLNGYATGMTTMEDYVTTYEITLRVRMSSPAELSAHVARRARLTRDIPEPPPDADEGEVLADLFGYMLRDVPGGIHLDRSTVGIVGPLGITTTAVAEESYGAPYRIPQGAAVVVRVGDMWVSGGTVVKVHDDGTGNVRLPNGETMVWLPGADRHMWGQSERRHVNGGMLYRVPLDDRSVLEEEPF